jgi:uncharacterized membrane protein YphA (DoxX/SURF4 family)
MTDIGRRILGVGAIGVALVSFAYHDFTPLWDPKPGPLPLKDLFKLVCDIALILGGVAINLRGRLAEIGAIILAVVYLATAIMLGTPPIAKDWKTEVNWENLAESLGLAMGAVLAWCLLGGASRARAAIVARLVFGACAVIYGLSDVTYATFTASLVPAWLPPSQMFWTWVACVAHIAAGLAFLSGVQARLAATLLTAMYALFQLLVHVPQVIAHPHDPGHWQEFASNIVFLGAAWCLMEWLRRGAAANTA